MDLLEQVRFALANQADLTTAQLDTLNQQTGRDHCNRRNRILHQLATYVSANSTAMAAPSTTHQFKKDFHKSKANIEVDGRTKAVTSENLTDEDVPLLKQYGYGHLIEKLPEPEKPAEPTDLHKLKKDELQAKYLEVIGEAAPDAMLKDDLIKAIEAKQQ